MISVTSRPRVLVISKFILFLSLFVAPLVLFGSQDKPAQADDCKIIKKADLVDPKAPKFGDYPTKTEAGNPSAKLDLTSNPIAKRYRTVLRLAMTEGANFAGHYRMSVWGCGTSCAMFAVVNLNTGKVITATQIAVVIGNNLDADDFMPGPNSDDWGFRFRIDSNLLVVLGTPDEDESRSGAYYFALRGERLHLIHKTRVTKNCENQK